MVAMEEVEVVGVVKAQPLSLSRQGKSRIKRHLRKVGWRFAWLLFFQRVVQGLGYAFSLLLPATASLRRPRQLLLHCSTTAHPCAYRDVNR
jgi:hypothetical protein